MRNVALPVAAILCLLLGACHTQKQTESTPPQIQVKQKNYTGPEVAALPKATIFKMSGDFADNVAITLNPDGTLAYYPAPSDLGPASAPLKLEDGWYLNRQGIGSNSVFTTYTFEQYRKLPQAPDPATLLASVIPGARITSFAQLPLTAAEAIENPERCIPLIEDLNKAGNIFLLSPDNI